MTGWGRENTSGQGFGGRDRFSGRGTGRGTGQRKKYGGSKNGNNKNEMKFRTHTPGQPQMATFNSIKDQILLYIEKKYSYGDDISESVDKLTYVDISKDKPNREVVDDIKDDEGIVDYEKMNFQQRGKDINYKHELTE